MHVSRLRILLVTVTVAAFALVAGCRKEPAIPPDVVAMVGDRRIDLDEFKRYLLRNAGTELGQVAPEAASALLDQMIEAILLSEYAGARGVDIGADRIAEAVRKDPGSTVIEKRDEMRRLAIIADIRGKAAVPDNDTLKAYYQQHAAEFNLPDRVHARQILLHDEPTARMVLDRLRKGVPFEELSREFSKAPNGKDGGDIGFVARGQLPPVFENVIFSLQPGTFSELLKTDNSYHLFKVDEFTPAGPVPFEQAAATIRARLEETAIDEEIMKIVATARKEIPVRILVRRLPFEYSGALPISPDE